MPPEQYLSQMLLLVFIVAAAVCFKGTSLKRWFERENAWGLLFLCCAAASQIVLVDYGYLFTPVEHVAGHVAINLPVFEGAQTVGPLHLPQLPKRADATGYIIMLKGAPVMPWCFAASPRDSHFDRLSPGVSVQFDCATLDHRVRSLRIDEGPDVGWTWRATAPLKARTVVLAFVLLSCLAGSLYILIAGHHQRQVQDAGFLYEEIKL